MSNKISEASIHIDWEPLPEALTKITGFMLYWVTSLAGQFYTQAIAAIGLEPQHAAILQLLDSEGDMVQSRLAERLHINKATMVFLLNSLEEKRFVERKENPADKRTFMIGLTQTGEAKITELALFNQDADKLFFDALTDEEKLSFHKLLSKLATQPNKKLKRNL